MKGQEEEERREGEDMHDQHNTPKHTPVRSVFQDACGEAFWEDRTRAQSSQ